MDRRAAGHGVEVGPVAQEAALGRPRSPAGHEQQAVLRRKADDAGAVQSHQPRRHDDHRLRPLTGRRRERAGDREAQACEYRDHDREPGVLEVRDRDEHDGAGVEQRPERDGEREPAVAHQMSERMAEPESSAFEMKPRAPLPRIIPS